jgi:hypothetical protein
LACAGTSRRATVAAPAPVRDRPTALAIRLTQQRILHALLHHGGFIVALHMAQDCSVDAKGRVHDIVRRLGQLANLGRAVVQVRRVVHFGFLNGRQRRTRVALRSLSCGDLFQHAG